MDLAHGSSQLRLGHLSLGVSDLDLSERFYHDVLGLNTTRKDDLIEIRWSDMLLILTHRPPAGRGKFHFGFRVGSAGEVDQWAERIRAAGVEIVSGPMSDGGMRQLFFVDPDNYEIEIYHQA